MIYTSQKPKIEMWIEDYGTDGNPFYVVVSNHEDQDFDEWWGNFSTLDDAVEFIVYQEENNYPNSRPRPLVNAILEEYREFGLVGNPHAAPYWIDNILNNPHAWDPRWSFGMLDHAEKVLTKIVNAYGH